jgi:hypothetical protein
MAVTDLTECIMMPCGCLPVNLAAQAEYGVNLVGCCVGLDVAICGMCL